MSAIDVDGGGIEVDLGLAIAQVIVPLEGEALDFATSALVDDPASEVALSLRAASETLVATDIGDTGTVIGAAAAATFSPILPRLGNRAIGLGDSVMAGSDAPTTYALGGSWFSRLCEISGQRLRLMRNSGVSGNRSDQMLARIQTDVIAHAPDLCVLEAITPNDPATLTVAQSKANIIAMVEALTAAHIRVILCTGPPNDTPATNNAMRALSAWLIQYANNLGIPVFDLYTPLVDPVDGTYLAANTSDGSHPNALGQEAIAAFLSTRLPNDLYRVPILSAGGGDASNLLLNGAFAVDTNADGLADSWTGFATPTCSLIATSDGTGNWQQIGGGAGGAYLAQSTADGSWSVGDRLAMSGLWTQDASSTVTVQVNCTGGTPYSQPRMLSSRTTTVVTPRTFYEEFIVPTGTTAVQARLIPGTNGVARFSQVTLRNMTRDAAI